MSRQYADRIAVSCRASDLLPGAADSASAVPDGAAPCRFTWRRRRYRVVAVLQRWVEVGAWWSGGRAVDEEFEMWRVEAATEASTKGAVGHFDLRQHRTSGSWFLVRAFD